MDPIFLGIDLGGTTVRLGAFDLGGRMLASRQAPIEARRGPQAGLERIAALVDQILDDPGLHGAQDPAIFDGGLVGIGIGATGPVDSRRGTVNNPYTLPTWEDVPITGYLRERFGVPVTLENDADVAALGEYWQGAGRGVSRLYAITVGTGIGTALILDGQVYRGLSGAHPDGGHHIVDPSGPVCYCGAHGCWESLASGSAIARMAKEEITNDLIETGGKMPIQGLFSMAGGDLSNITAKMTAAAALQGDLLARRVIGRAAESFALGVVNVVTLITPEVIVLSGGVMNHASLFMEAVQHAMQTHNVMVPSMQVRILTAELGDLAGLYGAAFTIVQQGADF